MNFFQWVGFLIVLAIVIVVCGACAGGIVDGLLRSRHGEQAAKTFGQMAFWLTAGLILYGAGFLV
jgi:hypothetical protein